MKILRSLIVTLAAFLVLLAGFPSAVFAGNPPDAAHSSLQATSPGSEFAPADGTSTAKVTLTMQDSAGTPLTGDTVTLAIPLDGTAVISPAAATLDSNGKANFTITSTTIGTDSIDATDSTTVTTLTALGQAIFTDPAAPTPSSSSSGGGSASTSLSCQQQAPKNSPDLYQISTGKTTATLRFAQPSDSIFDGYTIFYGPTQNADTYNISFSMGSLPGSVQYTVQDLTVKTVYYFKVRANNGCATGPWSAIRKEGYHGPTLPVAGPSPMLLGFGVGGIVALLGGMVLFFAL